MDPLLYAVPVFIIALIAEGVVLRQRAARARNKPYGMRALLGALGCVALDQLVNASTFVLFVGIFRAVHAHAAVAWHGHASALTWVVAVLGHDLCYYAYHRASHRSNVLWALHVVHHQSEQYDFTVSLRQGTLATWATYLFYLPLALVVPVHVFVAVHASYQVYQFFVHTKLIKRLGLLERVLATPSHHRVHHGRDAKYLDKNYGGFLIIFDRLFGTFAREEEEPDYGVPGGYDVVSPSFANVYLFGRLFAASRKVRGLRALARLWLGPPEGSSDLVRSSARAGAMRAVGLALILFAAGVALASTLAFARAVISLGWIVGLSAAAFACIEASSALLDGRAADR